ncbi:DedA family protein [Thermoplasma volcanium]|uniref:DedA family protein n=1 Tax=Thermoplasma volcanium TaxID=50339 RepID=UPI001F51E005|nr:DedA family protein [Thermoplasma volcanium]
MASSNKPNNYDRYFNIYGVVIAAVLAAIAAIEIFEIFELPFEKYFAGIDIASIFSFTTKVVSDSSYVGIFILMTLESMFIPIPSEVILPLSGFLVYQGSFNFAVVLADTIIASMVGSFIDYFLGLYLGRPIIVKILSYFSISEDSLSRAETWIDKMGSFSVFLARFIPGIRSLISLPAGMLKMKMWLFALMTFLGSFIWSFSLIYLGYSAGPYWSVAVKNFSALLDQIIIDVVFLASLAYIFYYIFLKIKRRQHALD